MRFSNSDEHGIVSFDAKYDEKYYKKYKMNYMQATGCHKSVCIKDFRYINWCDIAGLVPSKCYNLASLDHKRRDDFRVPPGFDHTSFWRFPNGRWPDFCLTEPYIEKFYHYKNDYKEYAEKIGLECQIYEPSEKSLWYPNSTYMILFYSVKHSLGFGYTLKDIENLLFSHEDAKDFEKKCTITNIKR